MTWRRAQTVLLSAQKMPVAKVAEVTFTSPDRVRDVIYNFNADGFDYRSQNLPNAALRPLHHCGASARRRRVV
jgi:hypothetical protein